MSPGLVIAAPASGSGKTVITLALLRALVRQGVAVAPLKIGPDYIDAAFHAVAAGRPCRNLDPWAMAEATRRAQIAAASAEASLIIAEGVMGLFDGAGDGTGSTADAAAWAGWPVVLVVDAGGQAASAAALVEGFANHRPDVEIGGVILNRIAGARHRQMMEPALAATGVPVLGYLPRSQELELASRHLGLVQAHELAALEDWIDRAAGLVADQVDLARFMELARPTAFDPAAAPGPPIPPLGSRIAVARDAAFAFCYDHVLAGWRAAGSELIFFSPLADEPPDGAADAVYLPGGYPELHAGALSAAGGFLAGLRDRAGRGATIYGECGGFMVLGDGLIDAEGARFPMAGLLPVETSFAERRLCLGYRKLALAADGPLGKVGTRFRGHEFHYSRQTKDTGGAALFATEDALGGTLAPAGGREGSVMGSYIHLIDKEAG